MIETPGSRHDKRALEIAIEQAFFLRGSAAHFATVFSTGAKKLHAADIQRIWDAAKEKGDLPKINRPRGGPRELTIQPIAEGRA